MTHQQRAPVTVITGTSRGIGLELAQQLASAGHKVVATLRTPSSAPPELAASGCEIHALDVTNDDSVADLASYLQRTHGGCDIVINNAGFGVAGSVEAVPLAHHQELFDTNFWGVVRMSQALLPQLRARGGGVFVGVSSIGAFRSLPGMEMYGVSKRALDALFEGMRYTLLRDGIRMVIITPGPVNTDFFKRFKTEGEIAEQTHSSAAGAGCEREMWTSWLEKRIAKGQPTDECTKSIVNVVQREWTAKQNGDRTLARLWNPTSENVEKMIEKIVCVPDGSSGAYAEIARMTNEMMDDLKKGEEVEGDVGSVGMNANAKKNE